MLPLQPAVTSHLPGIPFTAVDGCSEWDAGRGRTGASRRRRQWVTLAEFGDRFLRNETRHRFEVISSLHYAQVYIQLQKSMYNFSGYPGTRSKLIRVPGRHFTTFLTPLIATVFVVLNLTSKSAENTPQIKHSLHHSH